MYQYDKIIIILIEFETSHVGQTCWASNPCQLGNDPKHSTLRLMTLSLATIFYQILSHRNMCHIHFNVPFLFSLIRANKTQQNVLDIICTKHAYNFIFVLKAKFQKCLSQNLHRLKSLKVFQKTCFLMFKFRNYFKIHVITFILVLKAQFQKYFSQNLPRL